MSSGERTVDPVAQPSEAQQALRELADEFHRWAYEPLDLPVEMFEQEVQVFSQQIKVAVEAALAQQSLPRPGAQPEMERRSMALIARITDYLSLGGLFNPESMEHLKVRDLLMDCRYALANSMTAQPAGKQDRHALTRAFFDLQMKRIHTWKREPTQVELDTLWAADGKTRKQYLEATDDFLLALRVAQPEAASVSGAERQQELAQKIRAFINISDKIQMNLRDAQIWHPQNFIEDGVQQMCEMWNKALRELTATLDALAVSSGKRVAVEWQLELRSSGIWEMVEEVPYGNKWKCIMSREQLEAVLVAAQPAGERTPGEDAWLGELESCDGNVNCMRTILRAYRANLLQHSTAAQPADGAPDYPLAIRELDAKNLDFYAKLFREHKWEIREMSFTVFAHTLEAVARRLREQPADGALRNLPAKWRKSAFASREEAGRIRRTVNCPTEAEVNCNIRAELWDKNADELERALAAQDGK